MNYAAIMLCDTLNGVGFRTSLFVSGCGKEPKCKYCQNKKAWDFNYGNKFTEKEKNMIFKEQEKPWMKGISLLGGEVTDNLDDGVLLEFLKEYKKNLFYNYIFNQLFTIIFFCFKNNFLIVH